MLVVYVLEIGRRKPSFLIDDMIDVLVSVRIGSEHIILPQLETGWISRKRESFDPLESLLGDLERIVVVSADGGAANSIGMISYRSKRPNKILIELRVPFSGKSCRLRNWIKVAYRVFAR